MDGPSSTTTTTATASPQTQTASPPPQIPRARSSPANEHGPGSPQGGQPGSQPYPYGVPSAGWAPSPTAQPFYPQFYQNAPGPYPMHGHPGAPMPGQMAPPSPYYDPAANAQFAQWAYQQMMYNQAHQMQQGFPPPMVRVICFHPSFSLPY